MRFVDRTVFQCAPDPVSDDGVLVTIDGATARMAGRHVEAVVACEATDPVQGYLLFLTADVPDEETLTIALVDPALRPLDGAWLGGLYATGAWRDPAIEAPGRMRFRFIDRKVWRLTLLPAPALRPLFGEPRGSHRGLGLWRHFALSTAED